MNGIFFLLLFSNIVLHVDIIELNHVYDHQGEAGLDQLILWNWTKHESGTLQRKPLGYIVLDRKLHREQLTPEEWAQKNREYQKEWSEKWKASRNIPNYNPKFIYTMYCPYYDYNRKLWTVHIKNYRIYAISYIESWTQYDVEVEARKYWEDYNGKNLNGNQNR
jgi:hypothetical protein